MLIAGVVLILTGVGVMAWSFRPWGYTRAAWRGMTGDDVGRWDGVKVTESQRRQTRAGLTLTVGGLVLVVLAVAL